MPDALRLGVVGCGRVFERFHLPAIERAAESARRVALVAVCDADAARRAWAAARLPTVAVVASIAELVRTRPDAVVVLTPPTTHRDISTATLEAGLHVLVEKPMALTAADARAMAAAAASAKRCLHVGFTRRHRSPYLRLAGAIGRMNIGAPRAARFELSFPIGTWAAHDAFLGRDALGGGVLDDVLSHQIDLLGALWGTWPESARVLAAPEHERTRARITCELRFPGGALARCVAAHGAYVERLELELARGHIMAASGTAVWRARRWAGPVARRAAIFGDQVALARGKLTRRRGVTARSFERQLDEFVRALHDGGLARAGPPEGGAGDTLRGADAAAGVRVVATIDACRASVASGGKWVDAA
ncbi:MAG TPA: Gfo/Idh/MocA family oxidoreductase [Gemmatimonadales bacterium]|nr:Gfo/Idh/MocA family oxidoreductase [Gemmatimonadales bacterium]